MEYKVTVTPLLERTELIAARVENSKHTHKLFDFRSGVEELPVIKLDIGMPIYRMDNCRTFSEQQNKIATTGLDNDFFECGQENASAQAMQHEILIAISNERHNSITPIRNVLESEGQREPLLITHSGVIVNGNRRLSTMREINHQTNGTSFGHVECFVLPSDTTPDEIDDIEANLQARSEVKMKYDWIGDAQLVRRQIAKGRTNKEVARQLRRRPADIANHLASLNEADLYLSSWLGKPKQYGLIGDEAEQIFSDIPKKIANKEPNLENASRVIAWTLFENRDQLDGRLYSYNDAFGVLANEVMEDAAKMLDISLVPEDDEDSEDEFDIAIEGSATDISYDPLIELLKDGDDKDETVAILIDACEAAIERKKGRVSENAALKTLTNANGKIAGIAVEMAGEKTLPGMLKQIESIRKNLISIEEKINKRTKNARVDTA